MEFALELPMAAVSSITDGYPTTPDPQDRLRQYDTRAVS